LSAPSNEHWLADLLRTAQVSGSDDLHLSARAPNEEAWGVASRTCQISPDVIAEHVARHFQLELADLEAVTAQAIQLLPEKLARRHGILPLRQSDHAFVLATADPMDSQMETDVEFATGRRPVFEIASPQGILDAINEHYGHGEIPLAIDLGSDLPESIVDVVQELAPETVEAEDAESAPVVRLASLILRDAVKNRASDIHIEPGRGEGTVRLRVDGVMRTQLKLPMGALNRIVTRIKVLARLDIADRLRPQDGRTRVVIDGKVIEMRISSVPTRDSEKLVVRLLGGKNDQKLDGLDMPERDRDALRALIANRHGIVAVTGPTGSGKTTTLYAIVRELANGETNIVTVEDPIEMDVAGTTQIQVEPKRNVTFASALRAVLRQDPDVILIGEIRDLETAKIAAQASMTGHLVLATLHTNDATGTITRLLDLGLDRSDLGPVLRGVVAQRLIRRVCPECAETIREMTPEEARKASRFGVTPRVRARGCPRCSESGYQGRLPVFEILTVTPALAEKIANGAGAADLARASAAAGRRSLLQSALERVAAGLTTLDEVERVIGEESSTETGVIALAPAAIAASPPPAPSADPADASALATDDKPRVLVVDDDPIHRSIARRSLEGGGFDVDEVANGSQALERVHSGPTYALVLTDLRMPGLGGREVVSCLRALPRTKKTPIVVATGDQDDQMEVELMERGADDYIRKPIEPHRLVARVRAALRRAAA